MYTERALNQFKNMWNKDEAIFCYCMEILQDKLTMPEHYQLLFYYYYVNDKFEMAVGYLKDFIQSDVNKQRIEFMSDDDLGDLCACSACCCLTECGSECCSCCDDCGCCDGGCGVCCSIYCLITGCVVCYDCCCKGGCI